MKRLSMLLALVSLLVTLLAVPVFAAGESYQFELRPAVALLPELEVSPEADYVCMVCPGCLPEGEYVASISYPATGDVFLFFDHFFISYEPVGDGDSGDQSCFFQAEMTDGSGIYSYEVVFLYSYEYDESAFVIYCDSGSPLVFPEDAVLTLISVNGESDSDVSESVFLRDVIVGLFGSYEQRTETITETLADGSTVTYEQRIPGIAGLDYEWLASVGLFALVLLSSFRLLGGLIKQ